MKFHRLSILISITCFVPPTLQSCAARVEAPPAQTPQVRATARAETAPAAPLASQAPKAPATQTPPAPTTAVLTPRFLRLRAEAQEKILGSDAAIQDASGAILTSKRVPPPAEPKTEPPTYYVNGNSLGSFLPIENAQALGNFEHALADLAADKYPEQKLRILAYGASHTQGDYYTGYLRYYLQSRFGNGGQGFVQLARINPWYRQLDTRVESKGFKIQHVQRKSAPEHGRFGLLGAAAVGRFPYAYARVQPQRKEDRSELAAEYELYYGAEPDGGSLKLKMDGQTLTVLDTKSEQPEARFHAFRAPLGWHSIEVRPKGNGPIRIYGLTIEKPGRGIVVDTLGINGTRAANMLSWDETQWAAQVRHRDPQLITLAYGTNETTDANEPEAIYEDSLRQVLQRIQRAAPQASCLLIGPGDFPKETDAGWQERSRLLSIIDLQRKLAFEMGCGFWDTYAFMGGPGSMHQWVTAHPPMAAKDHIHFTARGYVKMGMALGDALLQHHDAAWSRFSLPQANAALP